MAILEDENRALQRRVRELETELQHLRDAQEHMVSENAQLTERANALVIDPQSGSIVEKRESIRYPMNLQVNSLNKLGNAAMGVAKDMSLGGAFIQTNLSLCPGEIITLVFEMDAQSFKIPAEVIRVTGDGYGIKFTLDSYQGEALEVHIIQLK